MKHVFVFDPKAFANRQWTLESIMDTIGQYFRTQTKPDFSVQMSRYRRHAIVLIQQEFEKAPPGTTIRVYAIGSEAILFDCVNAIANLPPFFELSLVPYGETCDFLDMFGQENNDVFKHIPTITTAGTHPTDLIRWGVNYALNSCYIGFNTAPEAKLRAMKSTLSERSYFVFSRVSSFFNRIKTAFDPKVTSQNYTITIDGNDYSGNYGLIHVANGSVYAGRKTGAFNATPNDGFLNVTLIRSGTPLGTVLARRRYLRGQHIKNSVSMQAKTISIKSENQMWIQMDNEYFQDIGVNISVVHHALKMVLPDNFSYPYSPAP